MRVVVVPSDRQAVGYYRLGLPAMTLQDQGAPFDFHFAEGLPMVDADGQTAIPGVSEPAALHPDVECDLLILQRPMVPYQLAALKSAQGRGIRVVVELDDDIRHVDPKSEFGRGVTGRHRLILRECCDAADLVTVSTPALAAAYAPHGRVAVLPNYVPEAWTEVEPAPEAGVVGWTGSIGNHRRDLAATGGGVGRALWDRGRLWRFRAYGNGNRAAHARLASTIGFHGPGVEVLPWQPMDRYPHEIARLTVGIAPLANTPFNAAKSWLKPLEYAACGVPCVMSPRAEYRRIHDDYGIGILANTPDEWYRGVSRLLSEPRYRAEKGERDRQAVREHLTIEKNCWKYAEAWTALVPSAA